MSEPRERDHRGLWKIEPPKDMPLTLIAMLQETIKEAWASYGGVPDNGEQFWNHLVGNGMADVPRETSRLTAAYDAMREAQKVLDGPVTQEEWDQHMRTIRKRAETNVPRETLAPWCSSDYRRPACFPFHTDDCPYT